MEKEKEYFILKGIEQDLFSKYVTAMNELKIPESKKTNLQTNQVNTHSLINEAYFLGEWNTVDIPMVYHKLHELRLGLYSIEMMDVLGITDEYWRQQIFAGFSTHDNGKYLLMGPNSSFPINANKSFEEREKEAIQFHTSVKDGIVTRNMGDNVAYMRENHHKYQSKPYPKKSVILYTPEREFATKILSILDFYDSAITRIDKDKKKTKQTQEEFTSYQEARIKLEEEYRNLEIEYNKDKFPKLRMKGQEFIDLMYNEKIFRNKDYWWITPMKLISKELGHEVELETRLNPFR